MNQWHHTWHVRWVAVASRRVRTAAVIAGRWHIHRVRPCVGHDKHHGNEGGRAASQADTTDSALPVNPIVWSAQGKRRKPSTSDCLNAHLEGLGRFSGRSAAAVAPAGAEGMRPSRLCVFVMGQPTTTVSGDVGTVPGGKLPPLSLRAKCTGVPTTAGCVSSERMARLRRAIERSALVGVGREVCVRARDLIAVCHGWHWHCCDFLHVHELPSRVRGALTSDHRKYKNNIVFI